MSGLSNLTSYAAARWMGRDGSGRSVVSISVKASYDWDRHGNLVSIPPAPIVLTDEYSGEGARSFLVRASEVGPRKPRVDVLLAGALAFPLPIEELDVALFVGTRIAKTIRVFGDRVWVPGLVADLVPSRARAVERLPIEWGRSYGGAIDDSSVQQANPAGRGITKDARLLQGQPVPNFEDPTKPIGSSKDRPAPAGFGPVAPHWPQRCRLGGTYDEAWRNGRSPLPPRDFNPAFFNVAPADQQLEGYRPGEVVRLTYLTKTGKDQFELPVLSVRVTFVTTEEIVEATTVVDTVIIEPAEHRFSVVSRAVFAPEPNVLAFRTAIVGELTAGRRKAVETGRRYVTS